MKTGIAEGITAEYLAAEFLKNIGYKIVAANVNYPGAGELDIVALDGKDLVIAEVKYRGNHDFGYPVESMTKSKVRKILKATERFLMETDVKYNGVRFDVLTVTDNGVEQIKNAFYGYWH